MAVVTLKIQKDGKPQTIARQASAFTLLVRLEKDGEKKVSIIEKSGAKHALDLDFDSALDLWLKSMKKPNVGTYRFVETNAEGWGPIAITSDHISGIDEIEGKVTMKLKNGAEVHLVQSLDEAVERWKESHS
ncbi:MAG: hypothetical protein EOP10_29600 [Proteobacteria bacterium]|nr:MAG: hypothetical protein EOP10_29600 [Pseudomonadota bacterium]